MCVIVFYLEIENENEINEKTFFLFPHRGVCVCVCVVKVMQ